MNFDAIPAELKTLRQWVNWDLETRKDKLTKVPYTPGKRSNASTTDPATWGGYHAACASYEAETRAGIGFVITPPYVGIDLDHCVTDGQIEPWALRIIQAVDSYSEYSQSKQGIHILIKGALPPDPRRLGQGKRKGPIEVYAGDRYFCMTGDHVEHTPRTIEDRAAELNTLYTELWPEPSAAPVNSTGGAPTLRDDDILEIARHAANRGKFCALWGGTWESYYPSQSEADAGLLGELAFYSDDRAQLDRLFRRSGLAGQKWGRNDYRERTLNLVLTPGRARYSGRQTATTTPAAATDEPELPATDEPPAKAKAKAPLDLGPAADSWRDLDSHQLGYDSDGDIWRQWTGTHWAELKENSTRLTKQAETCLRRVDIPIANTGRITGTILLAQWRCERTFALAPGRVNFLNGTWDQLTNALEGHKRSDGFTYCLPYAYAPGAHERADQFLSETIPDATARQALLLHFGLAMLGDTRLHYAAVLIGQPRSGKSTLLTLGNLLCGQAAAAFAGPELFDRQIEGMRSRATWRTKRLVAIDELPVEALRNEELVKQMTAHSGVSMRRLHQAEETDNQWRPKLIMSTNEAPRYTDATGALTGRLIPIRCPNHRPENARNIYLLDSLIPELPALAATCLDLARQALGNRYAVYPFSAEMRQILAEIEQDGDPLKSFVGERCIIDFTEGANGKFETWISSAALYAEYQDYCKLNGHTRPLSQQTLTSRLGERYHVRKDDVRKVQIGSSTEKKAVRGIGGIRLRTVGDDPDESPGYGSYTVTGKPFSIYADHNPNEAQHNGHDTLEEKSFSRNRVTAVTDENPCPDCGGSLPCDCKGGAA